MARIKLVYVGGGFTRAAGPSAGAWDLARAMRMDYRPADPEVLVAGWQAGLPHLAAPAGEPWEALLIASGRSPDWRP